MWEQYEQLVAKGYVFERRSALVTVRHGFVVIDRYHTFAEAVYTVALYEEYK